MAAICDRGPVTNSLARPKRAAAAPLSPDRTFVVQLAPPSRAGRVGAGRVEHVTSGKAAFFATWRQLQRFVVESLIGPRADSVAKGRAPSPAKRTAPAQERHPVPGSEGPEEGGT